MKKILTKKNILRAILFPVVFYVFLLLFSDIASSLINEHFLKSEEIKKFDVIIPVFLIFLLVGGLHFSILITLKIIPEHKQMPPSVESKYKPKLKDWLIILAIFSFIIVYSLIFTFANFSAIQTVGYLLFGMFLIVLITLVIKLYYLNNHTEGSSLE